MKEQLLIHPEKQGVEICGCNHRPRHAPSDHTIVMSCNDVRRVCDHCGLDDCACSAPMRLLAEISGETIHLVYDA